MFGKTGSVEQIEDLRKYNQQTCNDSAFHWNTLANEEGGEFNRLLITVATITIPLSFLPLSNDKLLSSLVFSDRCLMVGSWVALIFSIVFGEIQLFKFFEFHDRLAIKENNRGKLFSETLINLNATDATKKYNQMVKISNDMVEAPKHATRRYLKIQIAFLLVGISIMVFTLGKAFLFSK